MMSNQRYVHTIEFKDENYEVTPVTTSDEIVALSKGGWQKYDEAVFKGIHIHCYRKAEAFRCTEEYEYYVSGIRNKYLVFIFLK